MLPYAIIEQLVAKQGDLDRPSGGIQETLTVCCFLSILLPAGVCRMSAGPIILGLYLYLVFLTQEQSRNGYLIGVSCTILVYRWLDLVVIHRPERDFWKVDVDADGTKREGRAPEGLWPKLKWAFFLWNNQRGVGWNIEPDCLSAPISARCSRSTFLKLTLLRFINGGVIEYLAQTTLKIAYFYYLSEYPWDDYSYRFFQLPLLAQVVLSWAAAFKLYARVNIVYYLAALLTVPLQIYEPHDWPCIFGDFVEEAWSVRNMWGRCWHQMMRRPCSEAGRIVKSIFGFRKGGPLSRYSQVWVGFAVSASAHHVGAKVGMYEDGGYWQAVYFMAQPAAIMFEDGIMALARKAGVQSSHWTKVIGKVWVLLWFSWTLRFMVAYQPFSWLIDEKIIPWSHAIIAATSQTDPSLATLLTVRHWDLRRQFGSERPWAQEVHPIMVKGA